MVPNRARHIDHHEGADQCYISRLKAVQKYTNKKFCQNDTPFFEAILREGKAMETPMIISYVNQFLSWF